MDQWLRYTRLMTSQALAPKYKPVGKKTGQKSTESSIVNDNRLNLSKLAVAGNDKEARLTSNGSGNKKGPCRRFIRNVCQCHPEVYYQIATKQLLLPSRKVES